MCQLSAVSAAAAAAAPINSERALSPRTYTRTWYDYVEPCRTTIITMFGSRAAPSRVRVCLSDAFACAGRCYVTGCVCSRSSGRRRAFFRKLSVHSSHTRRSAARRQRTTERFITMLRCRRVEVIANHMAKEANDDNRVTGTQ